MDDGTGESFPLGQWDIPRIVTIIKKRVALNNHPQNEFPRTLLKNLFLSSIDIIAHIGLETKGFEEKIPPVGLEPTTNGL